MIRRPPRSTLLSLHDALPISTGEAPEGLAATGDPVFCRIWTLLGVPCISLPVLTGPAGERDAGDRKSTRLNSSHGYISYAVFCLKKKKKNKFSKFNNTRQTLQ